MFAPTPRWPHLKRLLSRVAPRFMSFAETHPQALRWLLVVFLYIPVGCATYFVSLSLLPTLNRGLRWFNDCGLVGKLLIGVAAVAIIAEGGWRLGYLLIVMENRGADKEIRPTPWGTPVPVALGIFALSLLLVGAFAGSP